MIVCENWQTFFPHTHTHTIRSAHSITSTIWIGIFVIFSQSSSLFSCQVVCYSEFMWYLFSVSVLVICHFLCLAIILDWMTRIGPRSSFRGSTGMSTKRKRHKIDIERRQSHFPSSFTRVNNWKREREGAQSDRHRDDIELTFLGLCSDFA